MRPGSLALLLLAFVATPACAHGTPASAAPKARAMAIQSTVKAPATVRELPPAEAAKFLAANANAQFVDVRNADEYATVHAKGTVLKPLPDLANWAGSLSKTAPVVLICHSGRRSLMAANSLAERGFTTLISVSGGTSAWVGAGLPTEK